MLQIDFDRTIESILPPDELWRLIKQAFEAPDRSPIWPVDLEEVEPIALEVGATVTATYKLGPFSGRPSYHITRFESGRTFSYASDASHPLKGGATVLVEQRDDGRSALRWYGSYRPRLHPMALGAVLFVRHYFLRTFFAGLTARLRAFEKNYQGRDESRPTPH